MANAVATVSLTDARYSWSDGVKYHVLATLTIGANPLTYKAGGIACSFFIPLIKASRTPMYVNVIGQTGYEYQYIPGADASAGLLKIFVQDGVSGNPLAEMADATAIPAAVSGDTIIAQVIFFGME